MTSTTSITSPTSQYTLADMRAGAETAVNICMGVQPGERVLILGDRASALIDQALGDASVEAGAQVQVHTLEEYGPRPILSIPEALGALVASFRPDVSFYTASSRPGELRFRLAYMPAVMSANPRGARHGHMINITPLLMTQGMRVDYRLVHAVTLRVHARASQARRIRVTNPKGTDLTAWFRPDWKWIPSHGLYHEPGQWGNLPEGETFTAPAACDGVLVAEVLGDYFSEKYGVLATPVTFVVEESRVRQVLCEDKAIQKDVEDYVHGVENADRVGEFAIGTNIALAGLVGNLLQDEKYPGVHVAFGDPYAQETGADWASEHHMDVIPTQCTIEMDGRRIMTDGVFSDEILEGLPPSPTASAEKTR